jgi:hypothetical protein
MTCSRSSAKDAKDAKNAKKIRVGSVPERALMQSAGPRDATFPVAFLGTLASWRSIWEHRHCAPQDVDQIAPITLRTASDDCRSRLLATR